MWFHKQNSYGNLYLIDILVCTGLPEDYLYTKTTRVVTYKDFINKELVLFSNMDNERSIPSLVDGLKPGSRKVGTLSLLDSNYNSVNYNEPIWQEVIAIYCNPRLTMCKLLCL